MFSFLFVILVRREDLSSGCKKGQRSVIFLRTVLGHSSCLICMMHDSTMLRNTMLAYKANLWKLYTCMDWILFYITKWLNSLNFCWLFSLWGESEPRNFQTLLYIRILLNFGGLWIQRQQSLWKCLLHSALHCISKFLFDDFIFVRPSEYSL